MSDQYTSLVAIIFITQAAAPTHIWYFKICFIWHFYIYVLPLSVSYSFHQSFHFLFLRRSISFFTSSLSPFLTLSLSLSPSFNLSVWFLCPSNPDLCLLFVHIFRVCKQCEETASSVLTGWLHARGDRDIMILWPVVQRTGTMLCRDITSRWTPSIFDAETRKLFIKAGAMSSRKSSWAARGPPSVSLSLEDKASLWEDSLTSASPGPYPLKSRGKPL